MPMFSGRGSLSVFIALFAFSIPLAYYRAIPSGLWIDGAQGQYSPGAHAEYLEDKSGKLTFEDVTSEARRKDWQSHHEENFNLGFTSSAYWIRFDVQFPPHRERMLLEVMYPLLDHVTLYELPEGKEHTEVIRHDGGDMLPFRDRKIHYRNSIFELETKGKSRYYLRVQSTSSMEIPLAIWTKNAFTTRSNIETMVLGTYYGMLLIMAAYNFVLALILRDRISFIYVFYIISAALTQATLHGLTAQYLWNDSPEWVNLSLPFWLSMDLFWGTLFCSLFLNTRENLRYLHRILIGVIGMTLLGSGLGFVAGYAIAMKYILIPLLVIPVLLFAAGIRSYFSGVRIARIFLLAWGVLLIAIAVAAIKAMGFFPTNFFTEYAVQIGTVLQVLLLSLALADRINIIKKEREEALSLRLMESEKVASLSQTFKKFVPHEFLQYLQKDDVTQISLGDNVHRTMSVLFADIRSFTALSEKMSPDETFRFINSYLSHMQPLISRNGGFIDKYLGDAIMALFDGEPEEALRTAIEMQKALVEYNAQRGSRGEADLRIGIGINTGPLMLGIIGGLERLEGTVIADAVNLASRVEGMTKMYGASILITENTYNNIANPEAFSMRAIDRVRVRGKSNAVTIYEVLDGEHPESRAGKLFTLSLFQQAMELYTGLEFQEALDLFMQCHRMYEHDPVAQLYIKRCRYYLQNGWKGDEPGVHVMGEQGFKSKV